MIEIINENRISAEKIFHNINYEEKCYLIELLVNELPSDTLKAIEPEDMLVSLSEESKAKLIKLFADEKPEECLNAVTQAIRRDMERVKKIKEI